MAVRRLSHTRMLLHPEGRATQDAIAAALHIGRATLVCICQCLVEDGLEAALQDWPRSGAQRKRDAKPAALLIALACS